VKKGRKGRSFRSQGIFLCKIRSLSVAHWIKGDPKKGEGRKLTPADQAGRGEGLSLTKKENLTHQKTFTVGPSSRSTLHKNSPQQGRGNAGEGVQKRRGNASVRLFTDLVDSSAVEHSTTSRKGNGKCSITPNKRKNGCQNPLLSLTGGGSGSPVGASEGGGAGDYEEMPRLRDSRVARVRLGVGRMGGGP